MRSLKKIGILILLIFFTGRSVPAVNNDNPIRLKIDPALLHPTQSLVGEFEVQWRKRKMLSLFKKGNDELRAYLKEEPGLVIIGPGQIYWIVDGHHHAKALDELKKDNEKFQDVFLRVDIAKDWSDLSTGDFESAMKRGTKKPDISKRPFVFLEDDPGRAIAFTKLPPHLSDLSNYPLRSVVWLVEKTGAIEKVKEYPFQEFVIAKQLRSNGIGVAQDGGREAYLAATKKALQWLVNANPSDIPGLQRYGVSDINSMLQKAVNKLDQY